MSAVSDDGSMSGTIELPPSPERPPSRYNTETEAADLLRLSGLDDDDPRRGALRDDIVTAHLNLVHHIARRFGGRGEPHADLVQVGTIGLIKAVDRFDPDRGVPFAGYAAPTITGEIKRHFRDRGWAMRLPRRLQETRQQISVAREDLTHELMRAPTVEELSRRAGVDMDTVIEVLESVHAMSTVPLDTEAGADSWLGGEDEALIGVDNRESLRPLLAKLPARERRIIALRFVRGMSQSQIAAEVGLSQMHVSRLLSRTLATLRSELETDADGSR